METARGLEICCSYKHIIPTLVSVSPLKSFVECQITLDSLFISLSSNVVKKEIWPSAAPLMKTCLLNWKFLQLFGSHRSPVTLLWFCPSVLCPKASRGDIGHAVGLLTSQPQQAHDPGDPQQPAVSGETWEGQSGTLDAKHIDLKHPNLSTTACFKSQWCQKCK